MLVICTLQASCKSEVWKQIIKIASPIFNRLNHGGVSILFKLASEVFSSTIDIKSTLNGFLSTSGILNITVGRKAC